VSIAEVQACLARLYLSDGYRHWFYADPAGALASYRLEPDERDALAGLPRDQLELFASSLVAKRRKGTEVAYPASFTIDDATLRWVFHRYHQLFPLRSDQSRADDAIAFGHFAEASLADEAQAVAYLGDLVRYERLYYTASLDRTVPAAAAVTTVPNGRAADAHPVRRPYVELAGFAHDVGAIEEAVCRGDPAPPAAQVCRACSILFVPAGDGREARMLRINDATVAIVERCDGRRTVAAVIADTEAALGVGGLGDAIVETITRLVAADVLALGGERDGATPPAYQVTTESEAL
jgi:hypothetical protein